MISRYNQHSPHPAQSGRFRRLAGIAEVKLRLNGEAAFDTRLVVNGVFGTLGHFKNATDLHPQSAGTHVVEELKELRATIPALRLKALSNSRAFRCSGRAGSRCG